MVRWKHFHGKEERFSWLGGKKIRVKNRKEERISGQKTWFMAKGGSKFRAKHGFFAIKMGENGEFIGLKEERFSG